jgi:hypothetical protein
MPPGVQAAFEENGLYTGPNGSVVFISRLCPRHYTGGTTTYNPLNAELNPICHLLALQGSATIVVVSRLRVKHRACYEISKDSYMFRPLHLAIIRP